MLSADAQDAQNAFSYMFVNYSTKEKWTTILKTVTSRK